MTMKGSRSAEITDHYSAFLSGLPARRFTRKYPQYSIARIAKNRSTGGDSSAFSAAIFAVSAMMAFLAVSAACPFGWHFGYHKS
jgi:anthranilate phosphoribosyltransferase